MAVAGSYSLKWHAHGSHLNSSIAMLYRCSAFTDVVLATSDGRYVSAHQFVLSSSSQYLHNLFMIGGNTSKSNSKLVVILPPQIAYSTLNLLLQYIYKGEAIVNQEQLPGIMKAAEILQVRGLYPPNSIQEDPKTKNILKELISSGSGGKSILKTANAKPNNKEMASEVTSMHAYSTSPSSNSTMSRQTSPIILSPVRKRQKSCITEPVKENKQKDYTSALEDLIIVGEEIQVKEETVSWDDQKSLENNTDIKEELKSEDEDVEVEVTEEDGYVPLTCDLCHETFTSPALWVRHIETKHPSTALASGKQLDDDGSKEYPSLHCEYCQKVFSVPAEWVRHVQTHKEQQQPSRDPVEETSDSSNSTPRNRVVCTVCGKILQSTASMQIHIRTHTGERPYLCKLCSREFNVKSNFVRHMRIVHHQTDKKLNNTPKPSQSL